MGALIVVALMSAAALELLIRAIRYRRARRDALAYPQCPCGCDLIPDGD